MSRAIGVDRCGNEGVLMPAAAVAVVRAVWVVCAGVGVAAVVWGSWRARCVRDGRAGHVRPGSRAHLRS
ncbi:hypothetical protein AQJ58_26675 [Streptomyces sp. DSM 15324]|nr:hypothetical protein AQJ58_26675 [Streptomyces sp. DSM 15324]